MEIVEARLVIDTSSLTRSRYKRVHGVIALWIDETAFPEPLWTDAVDLSLKWWCECLTALREGSTALKIIDFTEGPFRVEVAPVMDGIARLTLVERGREQTRYVLGEKLVTIPSLESSVIESSSQFLAECERRGWMSEDSNHLRRALEALRSEASPLD